MAVYSLTNPRACDPLDSLVSCFTVWMNMETANYILHKTTVFYSAALILNTTHLPLGLVVFYYPAKFFTGEHTWVEWNTNMIVLWVHQKYIPFLLLAQVDLEHPEFRYLPLPLWLTQNKFNQTTSCINFSSMQSWQRGRAIFYSSPNNETSKKIAGRWAERFNLCILGKL